MTDEDRIAGEAARWQARLTGGSADARARRDFALWKSADPRHAAAAAEMAALWDMTAPPARPAGRRTRRAALAGGLAVAATAAGLAILPRRIENWRADHVTGIGERRDLLLAGGVRAMLNTDTAIADAPDAIRLLRGEAFFSVPTGDVRRVECDGLTISASACAFAVATEGGHEGVQVAEGVVEVERAGLPPLRLPAGTRLRAAAPEAEPADPLDLAWRRGVLAFRGQRVDAVAAELDRYRPGRILIPSASLRARRISGSLSLDRPDDAVVALAELFGLGARFLPAGLILLQEG